jgi:hypothetical protein
MRKLIIGFVLLSYHYLATAQFNAGTIGNNQTIPYHSASAALSFITQPSGGTLPYSYQWQRSINSGVTFVNLSGATYSTYSPGILNATALFRCRVRDAANLTDYTNSVTITVWIAGTIGNNQTIAYHSAPVDLSFITEPSGGILPYSYQWQRSINSGVTFVNLSGAIYSTYSPGILNATALYRCRVTDAGNLYNYTNSVTITVLSGLIAGTIGNPQIICYNTAPVELTGTAATGGTPPYSYQWQYSMNGLSWSTIQGATLSGYSPAALTVSTWYRRLVSDAGGRTTASNTVKITVRPSLTAGTIGSDQTIYSGTSPNALTEIQAASGGGGSYTYQWQSSADGLDWSNIQGATSVGYAPSAIMADTWYRRSVIDGSCGSIASNSVKISVTPLITLYTSEVPGDREFSIPSRDLGTEFQVLTAGFITKVRLYCDPLEGGVHQIRMWRQNDQSTYDLVIGPIDWDFSSGTAGWREFDITPVAVEAGRNYIVSITNGSAANLVWVKSNPFSPANTNSYIRYLRGLFGSTPGIIPEQDKGESYFRDIVYIPYSPGAAGGGPQSICYNTAPSPLIQTIPPTGGSGAYTYQWQSSADNLIWTNIDGATSPEYSPPALMVSTYYRRVVTSGSLTSYCSPVLISILPQIGLAQLHDNITILYNTSTNFNAAISGGTAPFIINYTRNGVPQTAINNYSSGTSIPTGILTTGIYTYALSSVTDANGCHAQSLGTSITVTATDNGNLAAGTIGSVQTICYNTAPAPLTQITAPTGGTGVYTFQWQSSADNTTWTDITGAVLSDYSPTAITANTYYRRNVISGSYFPVTGNSVLITVLPQITLAQLHDNITIGYNTSTNFNVVISGGTSPFTINYTRNGEAQPAINNYVSGTDISTGLLTTSADYTLTSVTDANGCAAQSLGTNIIVTVNPITLYTSEVPGDRQFTTPNVRDLGTEFQVLTSGFITKVRLYCHALEGGVHQVRLWRHNDQSAYEQLGNMIEWNFSAGTTGWRDLDIAPVAVEAGRNYIVSITNGTAESQVHVISSSFTPITTNIYIRYLRGLFGATPGNVPSDDQGNSYFRDIVFVPFAPGTAGANQSICYNTTPSPLIQTTAPTGGSGAYTCQWQSSADNLTWTNIDGATSPEYSPPALTVSTYYRRVVTSDNLTANGSPVLITVDPEFSLAQLHSDITIYENTSTYFNVVLTGGTSPFTINYTRNGTTQVHVTNYLSGTDIYTGVLTSGTYTYALTSVTDAFGCEVQSRGNPITVTVSGVYSGSGSSKALVIVNSFSAPYYAEYETYIKPYLNWFGIPYDICDINSMTLPDFNNYAIIIFGHRNVYPSGDYPITDMETAVNGGVGLYSFDPHLFDFPSDFNAESVPQPEVISSQINLFTDHFITQYHQVDEYNTTNNVVNLLVNTPQPTITISATSLSLVGGVTLATMSDGVNTEPLLQVADYGSGHGRIVKWSSYDWAFDAKLGAVMGMDDIVWRGIVWAARKPFVMQGLPPMMTMRMDDVKGSWGGSSIAENLEWLKISNEYGFIPWCGTFINNLTQATINTLRDLINNGRTTASPHSFNTDNFIYSNWDNSALDIPQNVRDASKFYHDNGLTISKFLVPHWYLISSDALTEIRNMGIEFIGTDLPLDLTINTYPGNWLNCGPYRINRYGYAGYSQAFFYGGYVNWGGGNNFFICLSEMRDIVTDFGIGGGEWIPTSFVITTSNQAVRHLRRALSSMVLPTLFTHEYQLDVIQPAGWRLTLDRITSAINSYNPEYKSMDDAVKYVRAKVNINLTNVTVDNNNEIISISCSGVNDMETKCYLFTESNNVMSYRLITLPQVTSFSIPVTVVILNN